MATPEGKIKQLVKRWLKGEFPTAWYYMPVQNGMGVTGVPDFIICVNGLFLAIETKAPGKEKDVTPNQQKQLDGIGIAGGLRYVVSKKEDLTMIGFTLRLKGVR